MEFGKIVSLMAAPLVVVGYGLVILNRDMAGWQGLIAGIAFSVGLLSAVFSLALFGITKGASWHNKVISNLVTGLLGVGLAFGLIILLSRI